MGGLRGVSGVLLNPGCLKNLKAAQLQARFGQRKRAERSGNRVADYQQKDFSQLNVQIQNILQLSLEVFKRKRGS
jgi:hypothetical protein